MYKSGITAVLFLLLFILPISVMGSAAVNGGEEPGLAESIVLLSLDEGKGLLRASKRAKLDLALAGVFLVELAERGIIDIRILSAQDKKQENEGESLPFEMQAFERHLKPQEKMQVVFIGIKATGDPILDEMAEQIQNGLKTYSFSYWLGKTARLAGAKRIALLDEMEARGIVGKASSRAGKRSSRSRYRALDPQMLDLLRQRVRDAITAPTPVPVRDKFLASLVYACNLPRALNAKRHEIKQIRRSWRFLVHGNLIFSAINQWIHDKFDDDGSALLLNQQIWGILMN